eukprot:SAG22_NODE_7438_length_740_cov_0.946958_2_plen_37_part_00
MASYKPPPVAEQEVQASGWFGWGGGGGGGGGGGSEL